MNNRKGKGGKASIRIVSALLALALSMSGTMPTIGVSSVERVLASKAPLLKTPPVPNKATREFTSGGLQFTFLDSNWISSINNVTVDGEKFESVNNLFSLKGNTYYTREEYGTYSVLVLGNVKQDGSKVRIEASGYTPLNLTVRKVGNNYEFSVEEEKPVPNPSKDKSKEEKEKDEKDTVTVNLKNRGHEYYVDFPGHPTFIQEIVGVSVGNVKWKLVDKSYPSSGEFAIDKNAGTLILGAKRWLATAPREIQSGDIISIERKKGRPVRFKVVIVNGEVSVANPDQEGDGYKLHVRLVGSFDPAAIGQEKYDAVSGATGSITANQNSDVELRALLAPQDKKVEPDEIKTLFAKSGERVDKEKTRVVITPEGSGMTGVYSTSSSQLTLAGVPKKAGHYEIKVIVTDIQGRTAESNALPFDIFEPGKDNLADLLKKDQFEKSNFEKYADGKFGYTMTPWYVTQFGNNNDVTVPEEIKVWFGSHRSGTYGTLGEAVLSTEEPKQILRVPSGADLTMVNMNMLSGVKVVVEKGGRFALNDSVAQGTIEVQKGGTFSMNHSKTKGFISGASINGQLILHDGAVLEDSSIYSNTNNIINGTEVRHTTKPLVVVDGNVVVKGNVFIRGDESATGRDIETGESYSGQPGLFVKNGTLRLDNGARLAVYGGGRNATTSVGGYAVRLENGTIQGPGTLIALGGQGSFNHGGHALTGTGRLDVAYAYLQGGATAFPKAGAKPGKAVTEGVSISDQTVIRRIDGKAFYRVLDDPKAPMWRGVTVPTEEEMKNNFSFEGLEPKKPWKDIKPEEPKPQDSTTATSLEESKSVASATTSSQSASGTKPPKEEPEDEPVEPIQPTPKKQPPQWIGASTSPFVWNGKDGLSFEATPDLSLFRSAHVDGQLLPKDAYALERGSTVLTLQQTYLRKLSAGEHTLTVSFDGNERFESGTIQQTFVIGKSSDSPDKPQVSTESAPVESKEPDTSVSTETSNTSTQAEMPETSADETGMQPVTSEKPQPLESSSQTENDKRPFRKAPKTGDVLLTSVVLLPISSALYWVSRRKWFDAKNK